MTLLQTDRLIRIATPLGKDDLVVLSFSGTEQMSGLFAFELKMAAERADITFEQLAGKNVTVAIGSADGGQRFFNGIITGFAPGQSSAKQGFSEYRASMRPTAWLLTRCVDCRVFQDQSVPDIIKQVFNTAGEKGIRQQIDVRMALSGSYEPREICIQYNETDMTFIERLCAAEGIFYFFEHHNGKHVLVFSDTSDKHPAHMDGDKQVVLFQSTLGAVEAREGVRYLQPDNKLMSGKYMARDYNFTNPDLDMTVMCASRQQNPQSPGVIYEYPGDYQSPMGRGESLAAMRIAAEDARMHTLNGQSDCRGFAAGFTFRLKEHPVAQLDNKTYLLTRVRHEARQHFATDTTGDSYSNHFVCLPQSIPYRPRRIHPGPVIAGTQTAIVTGPKNEEIHTDQNGRVKVKFHWDRRGDQQGDGNLSCWIRVSQIWAGSKYGAMHIPRVGQEVIVGFLDGDPDRPIITGRVYHGHNLPPYDLPAEKTKSTIKSCSSKQGQNNFNEIRFEDLTGSEEFFTHAAKDQNEVVQNDMVTQVKNNQRIDVENNRAVTVASGNEVVTIQSGGRQISVQADEQHTNAAGFNHKVGANFTLKVNGNITIDASGIVSINGSRIILNG